MTEKCDKINTRKDWNQIFSEKVSSSLFAVRVPCIVSMIDISCKLHAIPCDKEKSLKINQTKISATSPNRIIQCRRHFLGRNKFSLHFPDFFAHFKLDSVFDVLFHPRAYLFLCREWIRENEGKWLKENWIKAKNSSEEMRKFSVSGGWRGKD